MTSATAAGELVTAAATGVSGKSVIVQHVGDREVLAGVKVVTVTAGSSLAVVMTVVRAAGKVSAEEKRLVAATAAAATRAYSAG